MDRHEEFRRWMCRRLVQTAMSDLKCEVAPDADQWKINAALRKRIDAAQWLCSYNGRLATKLAEWSDLEVDLWVQSYYP